MLARTASLSNNLFVLPDPVSEVLELVEAKCTITGGLRAGGDWSHGSRPVSAVKIDAIVSGSCWLVIADQAPVRLVAGDAVVLCGVGDAVLCSDPRLAPLAVYEPQPKIGLFSQIGTGESDTVVIGGHVSLAASSTGLFTSALPPVLHATARDAEAPEIQRLLTRIVDESDGNRAGATFAADQYAQLLLLEVLRTGIRHGTSVPCGWLRLLVDPALGPSAKLMHADPGRAWQLTELAAAAGMSRSHFARQFRLVSGTPPLTYLSLWRVRLAQHALRTSDSTVAALAGRLGYASESTFSHAFTRVAGVPPSHYRRAARARA